MAPAEKLVLSEAKDLGFIPFFKEGEGKRTKGDADTANGGRSRPTAIAEGRIKFFNITIYLSTQST